MNLVHYIYEVIQSVYEYTKPKYRCGLDFKGIMSSDWTSPCFLTEEQRVKSNLPAHDASEHCDFHPIHLSMTAFLQKERIMLNTQYFKDVAGLDAPSNLHKIWSELKRCV
ncbi:hypothetical protein XENOCAPTIV_016365 [Xenoophorus captivus]|uniref:Uncharacterized protein n=1 Tax=Xenoophorus captivus TaxID=1517983 RepID=A0ABV0RZ07_9TELE